MIIFPGWNPLTLKYLSLEIKSDNSEQHHIILIMKAVKFTVYLGVYHKNIRDYTLPSLPQKRSHTYVCQIVIILYMENNSN